MTAVTIYKLISVMCLELQKSPWNVLKLQYYIAIFDRSNNSNWELLFIKHSNPIQCNLLKMKFSWYYSGQKVPIAFFSHPSVMTTENCHFCSLVLTNLFKSHHTFFLQKCCYDGKQHHTTQNILIQTVVELRDHTKLVI